MDSLPSQKSLGASGQVKKVHRRVTVGEPFERLHLRRIGKPSGGNAAPVSIASHQTGLPLYWHMHGPVVPQMTLARRLSLATKRSIDLCGASLGLLALSPLLIGIAATIKLTSRGPVFFKQTRVGLNGATFPIFKFRSMYQDQGDQSGLAQTTAGDDRVTPIGRFMRAYSIDELPQLLNVVRGDMSLIGPRPHVPGMRAYGMDYEKLVPYYDLRHVMKPGMTGWAQANGLRGPTDKAAPSVGRIDHDMAYVQNFSLLLDVKILFLTIWREIRGKGRGF